MVHRKRENSFLRLLLWMQARWMQAWPRASLVRLFIFFAALLPLIGAYTAEYGFGIMPCHLCLYQRVPYWLMLIAALISWRMPARNFWRYLVPMIIALLVVEVLLAFYHSGVELHWWQGLEGCNSNSNALTIEELRAEIFATASVPCDIIAFTLLGLSMANWNVLYAFAVGTILFTVQQSRNKR